MFWVGLDARLILPDEFQADSPKIQVSRGQLLKTCTPRCLTEKSNDQNLWMVLGELA